MVPTHHVIDIHTHARALRRKCAQLSLFHAAIMAHVLSSCIGLRPGDVAGMHAWQFVALAHRSAFFVLLFSFFFWLLLLILLPATKGSVSAVCPPQKVS